MVKTFSDKYFNGLLFLVVAVNATVFFPGITEGDAMLYANISKRIAETGDWINLYVDGLDWLDKPHLPFWITALSFKMFGVSAFAYKLPAFLFWGISMYYTFRLGAIIYGKEVARFSVLIFGAALHVILANSDVRAEPYLTAFIIMATYFIVQAFLQKKLQWFLFAALASAGAIMTKGLFAGITIVSGFVLYLIFSRQLKELLNYRWWLCLFLTFLFIIPELYTLYLQFDRHPEKTVFGQTNVSGIKFFLWDSQFGRFFNTGPIKGTGDLLFFVHSTLWAFLPWSFFLAAAIWQGVKRRAVNNLPYIITGSALVTFILFSVSKFQLPHYIVMIMPHFALMCGNFISGLHKEKNIRLWSISLTALLLLACVTITALAFYSGMGRSLFALLPAWLISIFAIIAFRKTGTGILVAKGVCFSLALFWFLNCFFYPSLLKYQAGVEAATAFNKTGSSAAPLMYIRYSRAFELFSNTQPLFFTEESFNTFKIQLPAMVYILNTDLPLLDRAGYKYEVVKTFDDFRITMLTAGFLNEKTRNEHVTRNSLIKIYAAP